MQRYVFFWPTLLVLLLAVACSSSHGNSNQEEKEQQEQTDLIDANRDFLKQEREQIERFIKANNFNMQQTGSGLYYMFLKEPTDSNAAIADLSRVEYAFKISLLDGTFINSSAQSGNRVLTVGKQQAEIGLHEVLALGRMGCPMLVILPSHLAHGISKNEDDVPLRATLIYEITPLKLLN